MERYILWGRKLVQTRLLRVLFIGGIGFIIQTLIFELLSVYFGILQPSSAVLVGGEVGILCNFYLNNRFSFTDRKASTVPIWERLLRFHIVVSGSLFIQWLFLFLTEHATTNLLFIHGAYFAGVVVGFVSNYAGYYFWVWRHPAAADQN